MSGEIIPARLDQEQPRVKEDVELFQSQQVSGDVVAYRGMRAAPGLNRANPPGLEGSMTDQKFSVFLCEYVIGHRGNVHLIAQFLTQGQHEGGFAAAYRAANAGGESTVREVSHQRRCAVVKA